MGSSAIAGQSDPERHALLTVTALKGSDSALLLRGSLPTRELQGLTQVTAFPSGSPNLCFSYMNSTFPPSHEPQLVPMSPPKGKAQSVP